PSKSPIAAAVHAVPAVLTAICVALLPARHTVFAPVLVLRQKMSDVPLLSKSPTPTTFHAMLVTPASARPLATLPRRQIEFAPVRVLRHSTSLRPSASKSPTPTTCQPRSETVAVAVCVAEFAERQ